jgi:hypothetical protein
MKAHSHKRKRFVVRPRKLGLPPGLSYDCAEKLLEAVEGVAHGYATDVEDRKESDRFLAPNHFDPASKPK